MLHAKTVCQMVQMKRKEKSNLVTGNESTNEDRGDSANYRTSEMLVREESPPYVQQAGLSGHRPFLWKKRIVNET